MKKIHFLLLFIILAVFIWSGIKPDSYTNWALEVGPAVVGIVILALTFKGFRFTTLSYVIIAILCIMMFIGGHYTYSKVPFFNWMKDQFDFERNHYDRFGHFLKGFFVIVIREIIIRKTLIKNGAWLVTFSLSISLAIAALYEIIEWLVSKMTHGGKAAKDFLGTQGDIWDTQWDMLLTLLGSIFALLILSKLHDRFLKNTKKNPPLLM
ncbi:DUF2238 domain-containing protein [Bacillaceae bacterium CLA-AA-H227]|uniref:DUF2238 domain-containing protein n=1 Tax=Robertmurraya yapensis (ex Hitch et al 2024) TaxID=3133160 RepID=A0ACC6SD27_9BACI